MSPEKTEILIAKFPKIYSTDFYFECNDGWFDIIYTLSKSIQEYYDDKYRNHLDDYQPVAEQVKEKFGTLRFYLSNEDDKIDGMVTVAESLSAYICEFCGNKGQMRKGGWWKVECEPCHQIYLNKHNGSISG